MNKFQGCFSSQKQTFYGIEKSYININSTDSELIILPKLTTLNNIVVENNYSPISLNNLFFRLDGSLVQESISKGLFGYNQKDAQIFSMLGNNMMIRRIYKNYLFKGPFGGYWGSSEKDVHLWTRISCDDI